MLLERQTALADAPLARSSWPLSARLLAALSRDPLAADFAGGTQLHVGDHALDFLKATVPEFIARIQGKRVLDYGCGFGDQALSMKRAGAASVVGYDVYPKFTGSLPDGVTATSELPTEKFDIVLCSSSFEHFATPELELERMRALSSGSVIISWAEPWFSHAGSHAGFFTRVPWVNLLFPERSVMLVRSLYRDDGAVSYETGGLGGGGKQDDSLQVRRYYRQIGVASRNDEADRHEGTSFCDPDSSDPRTADERLHVHSHRLAAVLSQVHRRVSHFTSTFSPSASSSVGFRTARSPSLAPARISIVDP